MNKVFGCVDGARQTAGVCDYAAWSARRLAVPLEFLHVLDRHPEKAPVSDLSGTIGLDAQETLLEELSVIDEQRSKLAQEHGRQVLEAAKGRARAAGVNNIEGRQRHGSLVETLLDMQPEARLFVLGQHPQTEGSSKFHFDQHVEQVVRTLQRPVLVATTEFHLPNSFVIAFDGSATCRKMVQTVANSPLLRGLECHVIMVGDETPRMSEEINWAAAVLDAKGFNVKARIRPGEPEGVLRDYLVEQALDILVMGAYGHSRIRELIMGSTTSTLLRTSPVPVLIMR